MAINDYGQLFCEAVDTLIDQRLKNIKFDNTIVCTIIDDTQKKSGKYRVQISEGQASFFAFSEKSDYSTGDVVYVQIPGGDMNEQKFIIAKKSNDFNIPLSYKYPFANFINITGNLITSTEDVQARLIANEKTENEKEVETAISIWGYNLADTGGEGDNIVPDENRDIGPELSSYTRLGIQAQFRSWLDGLNIKSGSYGLRLRILVEAEDKNTQSEGTDNQDQAQEGARDVEVYDLFLNSSDMVGDPYSFSTFYQQEKVFEIEGLNNIQQMELQFYQKGDFYKQDGSLLTPNESYDLFVKDIVISLGYDSSEFNEDEVKVFSFDSVKYSNDPKEKTDNHREVQLRWIHKFEDGSIRVVGPEDDFNYEVTWYKYKLGTASHTPSSGADWALLSNQYSNTRLKILNNTEDKDYKQYNIFDEDWIKFNEISSNTAKYPSFNKTWLLADQTLATEAVKVVLSYKDAEGIEKYLVSNKLEFTNIEEVVSKPTVDAVSALTIWCDDESNGNYFVYNQGNELIDNSHGEVKTFTAYLRGAPLKDASYIEWIFPKSQSMVVINPEYYGAEFKADNEAVEKNIQGNYGIPGAELDEDGNPVAQNNSEMVVGTIEKDGKKEYVYDGKLHIFRFGDIAAEENIESANSQRYKISTYKSYQYSY